MNIVPIYAALLALLFVALSMRTLRMRRNLHIAVGDAGNEAMLRAMRVHANFAEYVPMALLLAFFAEIRGARPLVIHALCVCLVIGRCVHAYGVSHVKENFRFRVFGMAMTLFSIIAGAITLILSYISGMGA
jgi:uncharacterized membrane protein YecN with MAPEG domain